MHLNFSFSYSVTLPVGEVFAINWRTVLDFLIANPIVGYPILLCMMSGITFLMYGWDKRQAKNDGWRVPEKRLHVLAFLGGWPGAMLGQSYFRHKTQKSEFKVMMWLAAVLHVALVGWYLYTKLTN